MKKMNQYIAQLIDDIQASRDYAEQKNYFYTDDLVSQIRDFKLKVKTTADYINERKETLASITGIKQIQLPPAGDLNDEQKELLALKLDDLISHYHLYCDFPLNLPDFLKYEIIRNIWNNKYPVVKKGVCYIPMCNYNYSNCSFRSYCDICKENLDSNTEGNNNFIPLIYNYCDRWCSRCKFTGRCKNFFLVKQICKENFGDINHTDLVQKNIAEETLIMTESFDLLKLPEVNNLFINVKYFNRNMIRDKNPLAKDARLYHIQAYGWLLQHEWFFESKNVIWEITGCLKTNRESLLVLKWYATLISSKLFKAYFRLNKMKLFHSDHWEVEQLMQEINGSAKVALIAIDRSLEAWKYLGRSLTELNGDIQFFIDFLQEIMDRSEKLFPAARNFIRPGFDE